MPWMDERNLKIDITALMRDLSCCVSNKRVDKRITRWCKIGRYGLIAIVRLDKMCGNPVIADFVLLIVIGFQSKC